MYSSFFKFSEKPFEVTPDPKYFFASSSHRETLASLVYGIRERRGFICLTGEVGTGKTMLINAAMDRLDVGTKVAYLGNTALTFGQLLLVTLEELGILQPGKQISKVKSIRLLNEFTLAQLSHGGNVVVVVDEAQNLDEDSMENLRLLSNLETRKHKLIQIVLSGQPELDAKLGRPELRQLAQRISVRRVVNPLNEVETYAYIQHRLTVAGCRESELFGVEARKMIYGYSGGIPRKINILCDNALLIGYALRKKEIDEGCTAEAAADLKCGPVVKPVEPVFATAAAPATNPEHQGLSPRMALAGSLALAAGIIACAWFAFGRSGSTISVIPASLQAADVQTETKPEQQHGGQPVLELISTHPAEAVSPHKVTAESAANPKGLIKSSLIKEGPKQVKPHIPSIESEEPKAVTYTGAQSEPEAILPIKTVATENAKSASARTVVVERNDSLSRLIQQAYGKYEDSLLAKVLKENPEIRTPDRIFVGQVIRLPEVGSK